MSYLYLALIAILVYHACALIGNVCFAKLLIFSKLGLMRTVMQPRKGIKRAGQSIGQCFKHALWCVGSIIIMIMIF